MRRWVSAVDPAPSFPGRQGWLITLGAGLGPVTGPALGHRPRLGAGGADRWAAAGVGLRDHSSICHGYPYASPEPQTLRVSPQGCGQGGGRRQRGSGPRSGFFSLFLRQRVRLHGIDAPELRSKDPLEKARGQGSQAFVAQWFERPGAVLVRTTKEEKYGRMLADCYREGTPSLCTELLERGLSRPYTP
jgi:hypothetical protein